MKSTYLESGTLPEKHQKFALLTIDSLDKVQILEVHSGRGRMTESYNRRKNAGESGLIRAKIMIEIVEVID